MTLPPLDVARAVPKKEVGTCGDGGGRHGSWETLDVLPRPMVHLPCVRQDGKIDDSGDTPLPAVP